MIWVKSTSNYLKANDRKIKYLYVISEKAASRQSNFF